MRTLYRRGPKHFPCQSVSRLSLSSLSPRTYLSPNIGVSVKSPFVLRSLPSESVLMFDRTAKNKHRAAQLAVIMSHNPPPENSQHPGVPINTLDVAVKLNNKCLMPVGSQSVNSQQTVAVGRETTRSLTPPFA